MLTEKHFFKLGTFTLGPTVCIGGLVANYHKALQTRTLTPGEYELWGAAFVVDWINEGDAKFGAFLIKPVDEELVLPQGVGKHVYLNGGIVKLSSTKWSLPLNVDDEIMQVMEGFPEDRVGSFLKSSADGWSRGFSLSDTTALLQTPYGDGDYHLKQNGNQILISFIEQEPELELLNSYNELMTYRENFLRDLYVEREIDRMERSRSSEFFESEIKCLLNHIKTSPDVDQKSKDVLYLRLEPYLKEINHEPN